MSWTWSLLILQADLNSILMILDGFHAKHTETNQEHEALH